MRTPLLAIATAPIGTGFVAETSATADAKSLTDQERAESVGQGLVESRVPNLMVRTIDGQEIDLERLYGKKTVYLEFWATWCVPCREQMPRLEHTFQTAGPERAVIAINAGFNDSLEDVQTYRRKIGLTMPIVIDDGRLGEALYLSDHAAAHRHRSRRTPQIVGEQDIRLTR
jgi:thiol-disulfide isomerase/thioredoxin